MSRSLQYLKQETMEKQKNNASTFFELKEIAIFHLLKTHLSFFSRKTTGYIKRTQTLLAVLMSSNF